MTDIQIHTELTDQILHEFMEIQTAVFDDPYTEQKIRDRVERQQGLLFIHAYDACQVIGFKSGYALNRETFYSWVGGVHPSFRSRGISKNLMEVQHRQLKDMGFSKVQTKTQNRFKRMIILNLKSGFEIKDTFEEEGKGLQIILEKDL